MKLFIVFIAKSNVSLNIPQVGVPNTLGMVSLVFLCVSDWFRTMRVHACLHNG